MTYWRSFIIGDPFPVSIQKLCVEYFILLVFGVLVGSPLLIGLETLLTVFLHLS